jgi:hypothetical protein
MRSFASGRGHARKTPETGTGPCGGLATQPAPEHRCSLLFPGRAGPDGRARYLMLETLRAYAAERLVEAGEEPGTAAALAGSRWGWRRRLRPGWRPAWGRLRP